MNSANLPVISEEVTFSRYLEELLLCLLRDTGSATLQYLCERSGGAFPTEVLRSLTELQQLGHVNCEGSEYRLKDKTASTTVNPPLLQKIEFPDAHPLDFDWRFTKHGRTELVRQAERYSRKDARIALLGAPTLLPEILQTRPNTFLFDKNNLLVDLFQSQGLGQRVLISDLRHDLNWTNPDFNVVIADPPWYLDYYRAFIGRARELLKTGGFFFMSVLPWLTRPSASSDRKLLVCEAFKADFDLCEVLPGALHYESPPFEQAALKQAGLLLSDWRSGDLYIFRLSGKISLTDETLDVDQARWDRFVVGKTQIQVIGKTGFGQFEFEPVASKHGVLPSVSRRSPSRHEIDVWSSANLGFSTTRPEIVAACLESLQGGNSLAEAIHLASIDFKLSTGEVTRLRSLIGVLLGGDKSDDSDL